MRQNFTEWRKREWPNELTKRFIAICFRDTNSITLNLGVSKTDFKILIEIIAFPLHEFMLIPLMKVSIKLQTMVQSERKPFIIIIARKKFHE